MPQYILANALRPAASRYPWLQRVIWRCEALLFRAFFGFLRLLPVETASRLGQRLTMRLGPRLKQQRHFVRNVRLAFPDMSDEQQTNTVRDIWTNVGAIMGEFPHLDKICQPRRLKICIEAPIEALNRSGRPAIIVMAHLSNWEVAGAAVAQMGIPCGDAYTPLANPWLDQQINRFREPLEVDLFPKEDSMRPMLRRLQAGESLAFVMDQRVDNGEIVPFFGMNKATTVVPAKLGLRFDCDIIPLRVQRMGTAQYLVTLCTPVEADDPDAPEAEKVQNITRKINTLFEDWIRTSPGEWFPSKRRWDKIKPANPPHADATAQIHATD